MIKTKQLALHYLLTIVVSFLLCMLVSVFFGFQDEFEVDDIPGAAFVAAILHIPFALFCLMFFILSGSTYLKNNFVQFISCLTPAVIPLTLLLAMREDMERVGRNYGITVGYYSSLLTCAVLLGNFVWIKIRIHKVLSESPDSTPELK